MTNGVGANFVLHPVPTIQTLGLPPPPDGPESSGAFYHEALQRLPATRVTGWLGTLLGSEERQDDVQLLFHDGDPLKPKLRLVVSNADLMAIFAGLGDLLHKRLGMLREWNLRQLPSDAAD